MVNLTAQTVEWYNPQKKQVMKILVFKKVGSMMIVASLLMLLSSCHENSKQLFPSKLKDSYLVTVKK